MLTTSGPLDDAIGNERVVKLEIGAGKGGRTGWIATDLYARTNDDGSVVHRLDATNEFPICDNSVDYIYSEHMIEHIDFDGGQNMLTECHRILKPGGTIRIVTPSVGFLQNIMSATPNSIEEEYKEWSVKTFVPFATKVTNAFFLNNFMRSWNHKFIYDDDTMELALSSVGFVNIRKCEIAESEHPELRALEIQSRMPDGYLRLESMVFEATKGRSVDRQFSKVNLALGKSALQSSVSEWSRHPTPEGDASRVVSGVITGDYNCHTSFEVEPWWRVDLGCLASIDLIKIYNRYGVRAVMERTSMFEIQTSNDDISWLCVFRKIDGILVGGYPQAPFRWAPEEPIQARFVRIQLIGRQFLNLDQVEIYGKFLDK